MVIFHLKIHPCLLFQSLGQTKGTKCIQPKFSNKNTKSETSVNIISKGKAAVSFFYVAWVWLGEIDLKTAGTGLGTTFIA